MGILYLFSSRLCSVICRIENRKQDFLGAGFYEAICNVEGERIVTAFMVADFFSVYPYRGVPIDGAEIDEHIFAGPFFGDFKSAVVPQEFVLADGLSHT